MRGCEKKIYGSHYYVVGRIKIVQRYTQSSVCDVGDSSVFVDVFEGKK